MAWDKVIRLGGQVLKQSFDESGDVVKALATSRTTIQLGEKVAKESAQQVSKRRPIGFTAIFEQAAEETAEQVAKPHTTLVTTKSNMYQRYNGSTYTVKNAMQVEGKKKCEFIYDTTEKNSRDAMAAKEAFERGYYTKTSRAYYDDGSVSKEVRTTFERGLRKERTVTTIMSKTEKKKLLTELKEISRQYWKVDSAIYEIGSKLDKNSRNLKFLRGNKTKEIAMRDEEYHRLASRTNELGQKRARLKKQKEKLQSQIEELRQKLEQAIQVKDFSFNGRNLSAKIDGIDFTV